MTHSRRELFARTAPAAAAGLAVGPLFGAATGFSVSAAAGGEPPFMLFTNFRPWDTRITGEKLVAGSFRQFGYPGDIIAHPAKALLVNLTVTETVGSGWVRCTDASGPESNQLFLTSNVNWYADGQTNANFGIVPCVVGPSGGQGINVQVGGSAGSGAHLVVDVVGYIPKAPYDAYDPNDGA